jgi:iron-sulfur cluster assembly accessory protein
MITITDEAVAQIKEISESEGIGHTIIRVGVRGGGCAGYVNDLGFDDQITETDQVFEKDGVKIVIDEMSIQYLDNTEIDYVSGLMGAGFKFNNPNSKGSCGCGKSWA